MQVFKVNDRKVEFILDTGSDVTTITESTVRKLNLKLREPDHCIGSADGSRLKIAGVAKVSIESTDRFIDTPVYVVIGSRKNLLGRPQMRLLNLLFDINASVTNSTSLCTVVDKGIQFQGS